MDAKTHKPSVDEAYALFSYSVWVLATDGVEIHQCRHWTGSEPEPWERWTKADGHEFCGVIRWMYLPDEI
jgi:hypothetical protein